MLSASCFTPSMPSFVPGTPPMPFKPALPVTVVVLMQHWFVKGLTESEK